MTFSVNAATMFDYSAIFSENDAIFYEKAATLFD